MNAFRRALGRLTSPKKVLTYVGAGFTLLTFARVAVLIVESYSTVWSERHADRELIRMCDAGSASMSADFRALCLKKRAEQSAPVLLKALLRACTTAFTDFCESMSSPTKVVLLLLFCFTGVAAPIAKALALLVVHNLRKRKRLCARRGADHYSDDDGSDDDDETGHHEIVVVSPHERAPQTEGGLRLTNAAAFGMRLRRSVRQMQRRRQTHSESEPSCRFEEVDDNNYAYTSFS